MLTNEKYSYHDLVKLYGRKRLKKYGKMSQRLFNYYKNEEISFQLWAIIKHIEISLRNKAMKEIEKNSRNSNWNNGIAIRPKINKSQMNTVRHLNSAIVEIKDNHDKIYNNCYIKHKKPITNDIIISRFNFGQTINLCILANKLNPNLFYTNIINDLKIIKEFRNAIAHHENILLGRIYQEIRRDKQGNITSYKNLKYHYYKKNQQYDLNVILARILKIL